MAKEFIEREAAISARPEYLNPNKGEYNKGWNDCNNIVYKNIKAIPTADVQEVRHGKWIPIKGRFFSSTDGRGGNVVKCSVCGEPSSCGFSTPYCSICGAKMDKE